MSELKEEDKQQDEFQIMERADESQIVEELKGHYLEEFVYSFEVGSRRIVGLSWAGIKECAYRQGGITVDSCQIEDKGDFWMCLVQASDKFRGSSRFGVSTQSKTMKLKDQMEVADEFSLQKCVSKAQRNAIRALIPEVYIKNFVDRYLTEHRKKDEKPVQASPSFLTVEEVAEVLANANLAINLVDIQGSDSGLTVKPLQFMEPLVWSQFNGSLKKIGFIWVSDGKEGRWQRGLG